MTLGISSFGISVTTMEEVFIRVASETEHLLTKESRYRCNVCLLLLHIHIHGHTCVK